MQIALVLSADVLRYLSFTLLLSPPIQGKEMEFNLLFTKHWKFTLGNSTAKCLQTLCPVYSEYCQHPLLGLIFYNRYRFITFICQIFNANMLKNKDNTYKSEKKKENNQQIYSGNNTSISCLKRSRKNSTLIKSCPFFIFNQLTTTTV